MKVLSSTLVEDMHERRVVIALVMGAIAIFLGQWRGLENFVSGMREFNGMIGFSSPRRSRDPIRISRTERMWFIVSGALVMLLGLYAEFFPE